MAAGSYRPVSLLYVPFSPWFRFASTMLYLDFYIKSSLEWTKALGAVPRLFYRW